MKITSFIAFSCFLSVLPAIGAGASASMPAPTIVRGIACIADLSEQGAATPAGVQVDVSRAPLLQVAGTSVPLEPFVGAPLTPHLLELLTATVRNWLHQHGHPFAVAYVPEQDVSTGIVRVVVRSARLDGELRIEGAKWFSERSYREALPVAAGAELGAASLEEGIAWLNENPFRRASIAAEAGAAPGTTRLTLRVREERPWRLTAGYSNSGTAVTDEDRVSASVAWGNAFGRGDQMSYSFSADPSLEHSRSHSANYTTLFRSRRLLTVYGSWSKIESELPAPLTQAGTSWQAGARFGVPLTTTREGWTQNLAFTADFKASDNNLEFAAIPITNNLTHVVQFGATYGVSFRALGGRNGVSLSGYLSPGGLTSRNHGRYFDASRPGANAQYAYAKLNLMHQRSLGYGFSWQTAIDAQFASGALLGSEQLNGGGSGGVRGYAESSAFGDFGVVANNELHLPPVALKGGSDVDLFAFFDLAALGLRVDRDGTDLQSAGLGVNLQWTGALSVRAAYGRQLHDLDRVASERGRAHVSAAVSW